MDTLFGGSKTSSSSGNQAYGFIKDAFGGQAQSGANANNALAGLLGIGGDPAAANSAFQNYLGSTGYQFQLNQGNNAINSNQATHGLLNSGATINASQAMGQNLASNYFNTYLQQLAGMNQQALGAGQLIAGAGQTSSSKGSTTNGIIPGLFGGG